MPAYTKETLKRALRNLGPARQWVWEANRGAANPVLAEKFRYYDRNKDMLTELLDYCWCVYEKAYVAAGDQMIGRVADLNGFKAKVAAIDITRGDTLFNNATRGNILEMDKWSPVVNDCWILGGVHRRAAFRLESPRALDNLWDGARGGLVVTAREILGLMHFGYERVMQQGQVKYVSTKPVRSLTASVEEYDRVATLHERAGRSSVTQLVGLREDVAAQIRGFDRTRLVHRP